MLAFLSLSLLLCLSLFDPLLWGSQLPCREQSYGEVTREGTETSTAMCVNAEGDSLALGEPSDDCALAVTSHDFSCRKMTWVE